MCASFGLKYNTIEVERWLGNHPVFNEGFKVEAGDSLFAEYRACAALGLDIDAYFQKDRFSRMLIVGGYICESAINSMRAYDLNREREIEAERKSKRKK